MTEPLMPDALRRKEFSVAEYAAVFLVDVKDVTARTGPNASATYDDVDRFVLERKRTCDRYGVGIDSQGRIDFASAAQRPSRPVAQRQDDPGAPHVRSTTVSQMNAEAYADPALHRAMWASGVRDMKPPPEVYTAWEVPGPAWSPKPQLVDNGDGTGQWVTPSAKLDQPGGLFEKAAEIHKPGWTWDQDA